MNINKVMVVGRITQDLEVKTTPAGREVLPFSVATNYTYKNKDGEKIEETEFHNIVAWGPKASTIAQYCGKGHEIGIEGRLKTRNWDDEASGKKMYRTEIIMDAFHFGAKPGAVSASADSTPAPVEAPTDADVIDEDDIPF